VRSVRYPELEIIVVCTSGGSLDELVETFGLVEVPVVVPADAPGEGVRTRAYVPQDGTSMLVVEHPGPADESELANVGVGLVRARAVAVLHRGVVLTDNTLLRLARPFRDQPRATVATTSVARPLDTGIVEYERVVARCWPPRWKARLDMAHGLRTAVFRHAAGLSTGLSSGAGGLLLIRRDQVHEVGGYRPGADADDADLLRRARRMQTATGRTARVVAPVATPVTWRSFDPDAGRGGEPIVAGLGIGHRGFGPALLIAGAAAVIGVATGEVPAGLAALLAVVGGLVPVTLAIAALAIDDLAFPRRGTLGDLLAGIAAAAVEPFRIWRPWWGGHSSDSLPLPTD
jgi:hypothetical protein